MEKLKQKLSSRKLWAAIASGVLCIVAALYGEELTPEVVEVLKYAVAAGAVYIFGEGIVDAARQVSEGMKLPVLLIPKEQENESDNEVVVSFGESEE